MNKANKNKRGKTNNIFKLGRKFGKKLKLLIILAITCILKNGIKNYIKICLCAIVKNENLYIREFVEHYKKIGYNQIFLYDNNEKNGEHLEEVIKEYIKSGFIKIIDFRGKKNRPQFDAYKDCYQRNNKFYDWLSFYDIDEFLEINKKYKTIQDFLNDKIFKTCISIKINWLVYKNNNSLHYENKPIKERIKSPEYNNLANICIKSTVKGNLSINYWKNMRNPHTSSLNYASCSSSGKNVRSNSPFIKPPDYTNAKLKHYSYKSFEEYLLKVKRGRADFKKYSNNQRIRKFYKKLIIKNKYDKDKLKIINLI